ncbi:DUF2510 domain-containing protein [Actinoallomurus sp. NPDC050550]|uniref:DUF2510 domain-containing protein n=1 Tax=Actinoallomurus sp. NPDC050550 TaxID=3154937 RepID=UPI0034011548
MTPAGWYRDPYGNPGLLRWWDGQQWTQATQPTGDGQPTAWEGPQTVGEGQQATQEWGGAQPSGEGQQATQGWSGVQPPGEGWGGVQPASEGRGGVRPAGEGWSSVQPASGGPQASWEWSSAPPTWAQSTPAPSAGRRSRLPLLVGGGAAVVIIITVVAILFATDVFGGGKGGHSPVTGTITDAQAGISYPKLGGKWHTEAVTATSPLGKLGFDQGEAAEVMADYQNGQPYLASVYGGAATNTVPVPPETEAKALLAALEPAAYPAHTRQDLTSASHPVGGHDGWLLKVKFTFPQAKSAGWNFRTETAAILIVDRGNGRSPAEFYVSIPDSHGHQGDLDLLLSSLKVS